MTSRRPRLAASGVATGRGDDGTTGLLFGGPRVAKDDLATEAYGAVDEAVAALGVARMELVLAAQAAGAPDPRGAPESRGTPESRGAQDPFGELAALVLRLQRELFVVGAELATTPAARDRLTDGVTRVSEAMLEDLEVTLGRHEAAVELPREFIVPGETRASAALEVARTVMRRAERRIVSFQRDGAAPGPWLLPYVNRLADLLWILAREAEQAASRPPVSARTSPRPRRSR